MSNTSKEKLTKIVNVRLAPSTFATLKLKEKFTGVCPSDYMRMALTAYDNSSPKASNAQVKVVSQLEVDKSDLFKIHAELRRLGGLLKMCIVDHGAPRQELGALIDLFYETIKNIDDKLKLYE